MIARINTGRYPSPVDPSPAEIRRRARDIRKGWTAKERLRRTVCYVPPWTAPVIPLGACPDRPTIEKVIAADG